MGKAISYIRFSSKSQGKEGRDSLRRQIERTAAYCAEHGLELDESLRDLGRSAFKSRHIKEGALGRFLGRLDPRHENPIPTNTTLIVEAMDRLNRATPREALPVFLDIINHGVVIVTLGDGQKYDKISIDANMGQLFLSIGLMFGAHTESQNKSVRVKASWITRRQRVTKMTPSWITVENGKYVIRPECQPIMIHIFEQCRNGIGLDKIAASLNAKSVPPFSHRSRTSTGWYDSYVRKMITGRAALGEIEEHEYEGDVRIAKGRWSKPYPAAVSLELWQAANDALAGRRTIAGRKGETFVNLLQGLAVCECGAPMRIRVKGNRNNYTYYQCRDVKRGLCQHRKYINYRPVEALVLKNFGTIAHGLDTPDDSESIALVAEIATKRAALGEIETAMDRILAAISGGAGALVGKRIANLEAAHASGAVELGRMERALGLVQRAKPRTEDIGAITRLIGGLDRLKADDRYEARARINGGLARLLSFVVVTADEVRFRLAEGFSQRWKVSGTGKDGSAIAGTVKEIYFAIDTGKAQMAVE